MKTPDPSKPLGYAPMDAVHAEFDTLVAQALACPVGLGWVWAR